VKKKEEQLEGLYTSDRLAL